MRISQQVNKFLPDWLTCSGIQRGFYAGKPESMDLKEIDLEWTTNYVSYVHLYLPIGECA